MKLKEHFADLFCGTDSFLVIFIYYWMMMSSYTHSKVCVCVFFSKMNSYTFHCFSRYKHFLTFMASSGMQWFPTSSHSTQICIWYRLHSEKKYRQKAAQLGRLVLKQIVPANGSSWGITGHLQFSSLACFLVWIGKNTTSQNIF